MPEHPFTEEIFPNFQPKPPLAQLEAIFSCPMACSVAEEIDPHQSTAVMMPLQLPTPESQ